MNLSDLKFRTDEITPAEHMLLQGMEMYFQITGDFHGRLASHFVIARCENVRDFPPREVAELLCDRYNLAHAVDVAIESATCSCESCEAERAQQAEASPLDKPDPDSILTGELHKMWGDS